MTVTVTDVPTPLEELTNRAYWHLILGAPSKADARRQVLEMVAQLRVLFRDCFDEDLVDISAMRAASIRILAQMSSDGS